jgi:photosystem II stability/assembly factor-like uncharacterized protein
MRTGSRLVLFLIVLSVGCAKKVPQPTQAAPGIAVRGWSRVEPFPKPLDLSATRESFWVCGAEETIASSSDGGATWQLRHRKAGGRPLLRIGFLNDLVGHASGDDGLLLSTADGGRTWNSHVLGAETVQLFSFADSANGIAVLSSHHGDVGMGMLDEVQGIPFLDSRVLLTHDGGQHWEEAALNSNQKLQPYTEVLSVAALDPTHYLVGLRQPQVSVGYAVTTDAGRRWSLVHVDNVYATKVFAHAGEYWAFGIEYLSRQDHGGYGAPVSLHSKDGETWIHGVRGPYEFPSCNAQGCYLWDGVVEDLYGERERFWVMPQDRTLTRTWAIAGNRVCTLGGGVSCGPAAATEQLPQRPERP